MRRRQLRGLSRDLRALRQGIRSGRVRKAAIIRRRLGRVQERWAGAGKYLRRAEYGSAGLQWTWDKRLLRRMRRIDGADLLRPNLDGLDPELLWRQSIQLTEVEEALRVLKSELAIRPIWQRLDRRVEAHRRVAFLGYCLWVCLKQRLRGTARSLTPARAIASLSKIALVEVGFDLRQGGRICLPRIAEPETEPAAILPRLGWELPQQPPPKISPRTVPERQ